MFDSPLPPQDAESGQNASASTERLGFLLAVCSAVVGSLVLIGWFAEVELLTRIKSDFPAMNPTTAVCIIISGFSVLLNLHGHIRLAMVGGCLVAAAGAAKLVDVFGGSVPVDQLLFFDSLNKGPGLPNRMAPNTAVAFILIGLGLKFSGSRPRMLRLMSQVLAVLALLISLFAITGYAYGIGQLRGVGSFIPMALHTAVTLAALSAAIITLTPKAGLMILLRDAGPAGSMIRTVLPLAVGIPVALGGVRLWGQNSGYYGTEVGIALQVVANVAATTALTILTIFGLYRKDAIRKTREGTLARAAEKADWTARHDILTGLPNRASLLASLDRLTGAGRSTDFAILLIDIDDFKRFNDTLGHEAGDAILKITAFRLRRAVRPDDIVCRLGADEFAIILNGAGSDTAVHAVAEKITEAFREPWTFEGHLTDLRVSMGARICASNSAASADLLNDADVALQSAKLHRQSSVSIYEPGMRIGIETRSAQLQLAKKALQENLIVPFYQPKVELRSGKVIGFEALLRCRRPGAAALPPSAIAGAFDELELSQRLTQRMLALCMADMRRWLERGVDFGHVAVNAAAADFKRGDFAETILEGLHTCGIPPEHFQLEVTETVFLGRGAEYVERALKLLNTHGVRIALDDFGTGYASLTHLKQFPVHVVKIDRSFVSDSDSDPENAAIIRAVASLGRALGLEVVAEGVETASQRAYLTAHGCTIGQGYLFGKASPARRVPGIINSNAPLPADMAAYSGALRIAAGS